MIDLLDELKKAEGQNVVHNVVVDAYEILHGESHRDQEVFNRLTSEGSSPVDNPKHQPLLNTYSLGSIQALCVKYRLRFLKSHFFKSDFPVEAIHAAKKVEADHQIKFCDFRVLAPSTRFELKDATEDPILFGETADGRFVFIHQWGDDMSPLRRWAMYPFQSFQHLVLSVLFIGLLLTIPMPTSWLGLDATDTIPSVFLIKSMAFFTISGFLFFATLTFGILTGKDFSNDVWNDQYFN